MGDFAGAAPVVCVIDDDASVRKALRRLLQTSGFEVELHDSAASYLLRDRSREPDCLLLDIKMPVMSGLEFQRQIAVSGRVPPIVFITAHAEDEARAEAMALGAVDVLYKPLRQVVLLDAVRRALEHVPGR
jgi:FixJ family two-component response regulator